MAVVTGASCGIGKAYAKELAVRDCLVVLATRQTIQSFIAEYHIVVERRLQHLGS
ncbi:SDR family NAD(P)-dependent oxidoreductase [Paenibacillus sp. JNUCC32]|uniref:SDR family NAD(P)-dependent oxidoreductase n=1 Tax=unclassified Paenibacillus TaxID=185978 RepID=UPI001787BA17|nr:SDR family NAD(P)-dependent oxidoreductase [Paenibacillus sp. JNUCC-32]